MARHIHIFVGAPGSRIPPRVVTSDSGDWEESKHKRDGDGKFGSGGGGGAKPDPKTTPAKTQAESHAEGQEQVRKQAEGHEKAMPKGSTVKLPGGQGSAEVIGHSGNMVKTTKGDFHATKVQPAGGAKEPVSMAETETHPWVHKFIRTHSSQAAMSAAIAKNETPALKQVLAALEKHPHQGASQKMVKDLLAAELKKRNA